MLNCHDNKTYYYNNSLIPKLAAPIYKELIKEEQSLDIINQEIPSEPSINIINKLSYNTKQSIDEIPIEPTINKMHLNNNKIIKTKESLINKTTILPSVINIQETPNIFYQIYQYYIDAINICREFLNRINNNQPDILNQLPQIIIISIIKCMIFGNLTIPILVFNIISNINITLLWPEIKDMISTIINKYIK